MGKLSLENRNSMGRSVPILSPFQEYMVPESFNPQKTNCVEEDEFLDTHIDHIILKERGRLQKEVGGRSS